MKEKISTTLQAILATTAKETEAARSRESLKRVKQMAKDAPKIRSFKRALASGPSLIAEIKQCSPSQGPMKAANFKQAPFAYRDSHIVKAISVLTNQTHFGASMTVARMEKIRAIVSKPILRKDFITDEYQVYQSRAYGADAILLMANILGREELSGLSSLAFDLGMDVLFETHCVAELEELPASAVLVGINCRDFDAAPSGFRIAKFFRQWLWASSDWSVKKDKLGYASQLPAGAIKIAESGVTVKNCENVFGMGFHSALVGTSLLMDPRGIAAALFDFEQEIDRMRKTSAPLESYKDPSLAPALA